MRKKVHSKPPVPLQVPTLTPEEEQELDFYICCCIEEIENTLLKNPSEKQKKLSEVSLKILRNPSEVYVKKKQVMRQWFGDYKSKFDQKKNQVINNLNEIKFSFKKTKLPHNSVCYQKHTPKNIKNICYNPEGSENNVNNGKNRNSSVISSNSFKFEF